MPLESFKIGKVIRKGSYGEVCLVEHRIDRKQYVMKKVDLSKASSKEIKAAEQEAKLLSQLRHPNIVAYRESFQDEKGFLYIVTNFCEGGDLFSKLKEQYKEGKTLEETQVMEWFVQIAMAIQYMHERHILHRDLKTKNIFLTKAQIIKVGGLDKARVLETSSDMATTIIGTPQYMSPELFSNKPYNHKSDVWALGCCVYEMCTLRHAFVAKDMSSLVYKICKGKITPLPSHYSSDLCSIVQSMFEVEPEKRPSVTRLLQHNYIKKQIAMFLEGTKNRQKETTSSKGERISSAKSRPSESRSSKSDSGYSGSGQPPSKGGLPGGDLPASRSPRARRRYKVTSSSHVARSHYAKEEEEEGEDVSAAGSETSIKSVSETTPVSGLSARERRRLKERQKGHKNAVPTPPSVAVLPSPSEVIANVRRSQESYQGATSRHGPAVGDPIRQLSSEGYATPDGARPIVRQESSASTADSVEHDSDSDSELEEISLVKASAQAPRIPHRQKDVTSLISVLDATFKMSDVGVDRETPEVETAPEKYGGSPATSERLRDRIDRLRRECTRGIGEDMMQKAFNIIDSYQEDFVEEALVRLMGREKFERYGGPIWQLKFCESLK